MTAAPADSSGPALRRARRRCGSAIPKNSFSGTTQRLYRKRWYLANVKLDMFISILYVNIANLKSVPIEIFAEILNVFMIVRNIRQNSDVFYIHCRIPPGACRAAPDAAAFLPPHKNSCSQCAKFSESLFSPQPYYISDIFLFQQYYVKKYAGIIAKELASLTMALYNVFVGKIAVILYLQPYVY